MNVLRISEKLGRKRLYSGSWDQSVMIWDIEKDRNKVLKKVSIGHQARSIMVTKFREQLVTGAFEGKLHFWSIDDLSKCHLIGLAEISG